MPVGDISSPVDAVIREKDLISFDGTIGELGKKLKGLQKTVEEVANAISIKAPAIQKNLKNAMSGQSINLDLWDKVRLAAKQIDQMYDAQQKLAASQNEFAKVIALANEAVSKNTQSTKLAAKELLAATGSVDQLDARLKQLTAQWNALSDAERNGAQGQALMGQIVSQAVATRKLNAAIKEQVALEMRKQSLANKQAQANSQLSEDTRRLRVELRELNREKELEAQVANAAAGSYAKLSAEYALGKMRLKQMGTATQQEIEAFEVASKGLAELYEKMKKIQEATGKHTLSVGDYGKAIRGLSTETAMLIREMPSLAVSANTFFLAISNNLPMFMSAVSRMKAENAALAAAGKATTSIFGAVMKSVLSWQTAVIIALTLLSKYGNQVWKWFKSLFNRVKQLTEQMKAFSAQMGVLGEALKETAKNNVELTLIVDRLKDVKRGTKEWRDGVAAVNEITKQNLDATTATIEQVENVTDAYRKQAIQLAINEAVIKRLSGNVIKESGIATAALPLQQQDLFSLLPEKYYSEGKETQLSDKDREKISNYHQAVVDEWSKLVDNQQIDFSAFGASNINDFRESFTKGQQTDNVELANVILQYESTLAKIEDVHERQKRANKSLSGEALKLTRANLDTQLETYTQQQHDIEQQALSAKNALGAAEDLFKAIAKQDSALRGFWPRMSKEVEDAITSMYDIEALLKKQRKNNKTYEKKFELDPWYEAKKSAEALSERGATEAETIELWEKKKLAIELAAYGEAKDKRRKYWDDQQKKLKEDYSHQLISAQEYADNLAAIERQRNLDVEALDRKHTEDVLAIQQQAVDKKTKLFIKGYEIEAKAVEQELKGVTDPAKAEQMIRSLNQMVQEIKAARDMESQSAESAEAYRAVLEALQKQIDSTTSAMVKMKIQSITANAQLEKFGRATSTLGQARNNDIAARNINKLSAAIAQLRKELTDLNPKSTTFEADSKAINDSINKLISQMQNSLNRIDPAKAFGMSDGLIENMINSIIDTSAPSKLLNALRGLGFGDVVETYIEEAFAEAGMDQRAYREFKYALQASGGDIQAAIEALSPEMREAVEKVLGYVGQKAGADLSQIFKAIWSNVTSWFNQTVSYLKDLAQAYVDLAEAKAEAAAAATDAAQEEYEKEKALLEAGYANQVETKWAEYQEKKAIQQQAEADAKKAAQAQADLETAQQTMSLITAIANIFKTMTAVSGAWGVAAAAAMSATMLAAFVASKSKAAEAAKVQYGEGHAELIGGGSHASGHDSPLAYDAKGRERRVEAGEVIGVFRKRAVAAIGANTLIKNIDGINAGRYTELATRAIDRGANLNMLAQTVETSHVDLKVLEAGVDMIAKQGSRATYIDSMGNLVIKTPYGKTTYIRR